MGQRLTKLGVGFVVSCLAVNVSAHSKTTTIDIDSHVFALTNFKELKLEKEIVDSKDSGYDGELCVSGVGYKNSSRTIFLTSDNFLKTAKQLKPFDEALKAQVQSGTEQKLQSLLLELYCDGAGYDVLGNVGAIELVSDAKGLGIVADHGQDSCGVTELLLLARVNTGYVFMKKPLTDSIKTAGCKVEIQTTEDCNKRTECIKSYLAKPETKSVLLEELRKQFSELKLKK